jgi:hypothetical protein
VKARGTFTFPVRTGGLNPFSGGVYFISANLGTRGIATWAAGLSFRRRSVLVLYPMSKTARAVTDTGFLRNGKLPELNVLAGWGIKTTTYGYAQSRNCVK